jgi:AcrR family transcriptional regulator
MNTKAQTEDRRVQRTQKSLRDALIELIQEKHYDTISVQDIIGRANVGRSTFYLHFRDKEDLFRGDWQRMLGFFVEQITPENLQAGRIFPIRELFEHLKDFHHLYRALVKSGKIDRLFGYGQKYLAERIEIRINSVLNLQEQTTIPIPIMANYLASEVFSQLKWWLDNDMPYPPERMDEIFHQLIMSGVKSVSDAIGNFT